MGEGVAALLPDVAESSEPLVLHLPGLAKPLLRPAYAAPHPGAFAARAAPGAPPAGGGAEADALAPGATVGSQLREGPFACDRAAVWSDFRAALCDLGGEVVVDQVFVANLDARTDRMRALDTELRRHGLRAQRFPSVDGKAIPAAEAQRHHESALAGMPRGHLGCLLTHLALWREVARSGWRTVWILEDDATFVPGEVGQLAERLAELRAADPEWHLAYTGP